MKKTICIILFMSFISCLRAQVFDDEREWQRQSETTPRAIDFSKMFEDEKAKKEEFNDLKLKQETELRQKMLQATALEKAVDPQSYVVGPGDIFTLNIWGALEMQLPIPVSPEGVLSVPSVGEIDIRKMTLADVKKRVYDKAKPHYQNCEISLILTTLRSFRVHVVGEVEYPGTYLANPTERISDLIGEAGGVTDWANKVAIELRKVTGDTLLFNFAEFESDGEIDGNVLVSGGDVVFVPPISLTSDKVYVDGDFKVGGLYQVLDNETVHAFLSRIRAFNKNANPMDVVVLRKTDKTIKTFKPYLEQNADIIILKNGDRVVIPSAYVYVKGSVQFPGTYPYVASFTAKDYAGMAGGNYYSGNIKKVKVYQAKTGKTRRGPDALVEPGDVVDMPKAWNEELRNWGPVLSAIASSVIAAKAIGLIGGE
ncbi:SLBB domain-containing protein [bacterium]|nr:SLBB domain-containing protein [bacterium]